MAHKFSTSYIEDSVALFHFYKKMAEGAIQQVTDEQLFATLDEEMNSIAIIVKHMTANKRSRHGVCGAVCDARRTLGALE